MGKLLYRLYHYLDRRRKLLSLVLILLMSLGALLELLGLGLIMPLLALFTDPSLLESNRYLQIVARVLSGGDSAIASDNVNHFIFLLCGWIVLFYFAKNCYLWIMNYWEGRFVFSISTSIARQLFHNYLHANYAFHLAQPPSRLLNNIQQVTLLACTILMPCVQIFADVLILVVILSFLLFCAPLLTLAAGAVILGLTFGIYLPLRKFNGNIGKELLANTQGIVQSILQGLQAIKEVKLNRCEDFFGARHDLRQRQYRKTLTRQYAAGQLPRYFLEALIVGLAIGLLALLLWNHVAKESILLVASLLVVTMFRLLPTLSRINYNLSAIRQSQCVFDAIFQDLSLLNHVTASQTKLHTPHQAPAKFCKELNVQDMSFGYPGKNRMLFQHCNLTIHPGDHIAILGETGSGKTTLADLLCGLLSPDSGSITLDGVALTAADSHAWELIGYVPQNTVLLNDTIAANVAFGVAPEAIDETRVRNALHLAQLDSFLQAQELGIYEPVSEGGTTFSGGERQRLGIARALYRDTPILIFDEPTAALDSTTEKELIQALRMLAQNRTLLLIAHRWSTIEHCSRFLLLGGDSQIAEFAQLDALREAWESRKSSSKILS